MAEPFHLTVPASQEGVVEAMKELVRFLDAARCTPDVAYAVQLAFEELGTNIAKYGFDDRQDHCFEVVLRMGAPTHLEVRDDGHPFNPWKDAPRPKQDGRLEDLPIGGLGLHLIRDMAADVAYERRNRTNVVTVTFKPKETP